MTKFIGGMRGSFQPLQILLAMTLMTLVLCLGRPHPASAWDPAGNMVTPRALHTATVLHTGNVLIAGGRNSSDNALDSAELFSSGSNHWHATGSLNTGRQNHTATMLPNGKVLVTGGFTTDGTTKLRSCEVFDPATRLWTPVADLNVPRATHVAILLQSGKVLVAGNFSSTSSATAEIYDPAADTWTPTGSLATGRWEFAAALLQNGKVVVAGGENTGGYVATAEIFDPAANGGVGAWSPAGSMLAGGRDDLRATLLTDGKMVVMGGYNGSPVATVELYTPDAGSGSWGTITAPGFLARYGHSSTLLPNGTVLVVGGIGAPTSAQIGDPFEDTWTSASPLSTGRWWHTATLLPDGNVLVAGGQNAGGYTSSAEIYNYGQGVGLDTASLPVRGRGMHTATLLPSGKVLVAGGYDFGHLDLAALYDDGAWTTTGALKKARSRHTATLLPTGKVLVAGGLASGVDGGDQDTAELYDPTANGGAGAWAYTDSLSTPRYSHTATLLGDGKVLVTGGSCDNEPYYLKSTEIYDPGSGTWDTDPLWDMKANRTLHTATLLYNGKVLVVGGQTEGGAILNTAELYDPATGTFSPAGPPPLNGALSQARYMHTATLLHNGKVLVTGGSSVTAPLASTELYDPDLGTWTTIEPLNTARFSHTATLYHYLGAVIVVGGEGPGGTALVNAEVYDTAFNTWSDIGLMIHARKWHTATFPVGNGKLLAVGGFDGSAYLDSCEVYSRNLGYDEAWRPIISTVSPLITLNGRPSLTGTGFRGKSGASGGSFNDSATNYPLVQLVRLDNDQMLMLPPDPSDPAHFFSDTYFRSRAITAFPTGHCLVTMATNAILSKHKIILFDSTNPTAVDLAYFRPVPGANQIVLEWKTGTEIDNVGFYLWRADLGKNTYERITGLIPARGDATSGAFYEYADTDVTAGQSYSYKLEDVSVSGKSTFHGPITATVGYLNLLAPEDGVQLADSTPPEFQWEALPFDRFRLQFCTADDFTEKVVELPQAKGKKGVDWITQTSYTPTSKEWSAIKSLVGKKGGWLGWRVLGTYESPGSGTSETWNFSLSGSSKAK